MRNVSERYFTLLLAFNGIFMILLIATQAFRLSGSLVQNATFLATSVCAALYLYLAYKINRDLQKDKKRSRK